jgi:type VI protein secretion system component Hcp
MSFQWIIDKAETLSINNRRMVATTTARDGSVRAVSRGTQPKLITVSLPDGLLWSVIKSDIAAAEALDRISTATISIPYAKFPWYYGNVAPGSNDSYTVRCIQFPEWTIFSRDQVSWTGAFVFVEVL